MPQTITRCVFLFQGVVIGLEVLAMTVAESSETIEAVVKVLSGIISTPVTVAFSTLSRTAIGQCSRLAEPQLFGREGLTSLGHM